MIIVYNNDQTVGGNNGDEDMIMRAASDRDISDARHMRSNRMHAAPTTEIIGIKRVRRRCPLRSPTESPQRSSLIYNDIAAGIDALQCNIINTVDQRSRYTTNICHSLKQRTVEIQNATGAGN